MFAKGLGQSVAGNYPWNQLQGQGRGPFSGQNIGTLQALPGCSCPARKEGTRHSGRVGRSKDFAPPGLSQFSGNLLTNSPNSHINFRTSPRNPGRLGPARCQCELHSGRGCMRERPWGAVPPPGLHEGGPNPVQGAGHSRPEGSRTEAQFPLTSAQGVRGPESSGPGPAPRGDIAEV